MVNWVLLRFLIPAASLQQQQLLLLLPCNHHQRLHPTTFRFRRIMTVETTAQQEIDDEEVVVVVPGEILPEKESRDAILLDPSQFIRMNPPTRSQEKTHVIYGSLWGMDTIHRYDVFQSLHAIPTIGQLQDEWLRQQQQSPLQPPPPPKNHSITVSRIDPALLLVVARVDVGSCLDGHPGIVHGGILSLLIDDVLGCAYEALGIPFAVTANLNVNFRLPVPAGTGLRLSAKLTGWDQRKVYFTVQVGDATNLETTYCEATSLFIIPKDSYEDMIKRGFTSPTRP